MKLASYCHDCQCKTRKIKEGEQEIADEEGFELYAHDICPKCGKKFFSPAIPSWLNNKGE